MTAIGHVLLKIVKKTMLAQATNIQRLVNTLYAHTFYPSEIFGRKEST